MVRPFHLSAAQLRRPPYIIDCLAAVIQQPLLLSGFNKGKDLNGKLHNLGLVNTILVESQQ